MVSPPSKIILRVLRELSYNHVKGILILVPGSTSNIFNFGLATERAKNDDLRVKLIQLYDSLSVSCNKQYKGKGLTGIVLLTKIAGAMSECGCTLSEIFEYCNEISKNIFTVEAKENKAVKITKTSLCQENEIQYQNNYTDGFINIVEEAVNILPDENSQQEEGKINLKPDDSIVIMVNNDSSNKLDLFTFIKELIGFLTSSLIFVKRVYLGNFISSSTCTVTFMKVINPVTIKYLDAECDAPGKELI